jgi:putative ABC transport system permease protein
VDTLFQDLRYAIRMLAKRRVLVLGVLLTLALGIGATTSVFSAVHAMLFRPVPFPESERLAMLYVSRTTRSSGTSSLRWSYPRFQLLRQSTAAFESVASFTSTDVNLTSADEPERLVAEIVSASYFATLRIGALRGQMFLPADDDTPRPVALVSYGLWQRSFGADPGLVGKTVAVNSVPLTVVGILPKGFNGLSVRADLWVPALMAPDLTYSDYLTTPQSFINVVGRLRRGTSLGQAQAKLDTIGRRIDRAFPSSSPLPATYSATAVSLNDARIDPLSRRSILVLFGAVVLVLLVACANIASLLLARANSRQREMAIRLALGSSRRRLIRQLLTESLLLAFLGGSLGMLVAAWGSGILANLAPGVIASPRNDYGQLGEFAAPAVDESVFVFALFASLITGIGFGLAPALQATRPNLNSALKDGVRGGAHGTGSLRSFGGLPLLVVCEVGLSLVLLTGAGLLLQSFVKMQSQESGFDPTNLLTFWVNPPESRYPPASGPAIVERLVERIAVTPGVRSATVSRCTPYMSTCARTALYFAGRPQPPPGAAPIVGRHYVGPDHFRTMGIPILRGRSFTGNDRLGRPPVVVINQTAARRFWPGEDPIGKRVWFSSAAGFNSPDTPVEVVGIAGDVKYWPLEEPIGADFYSCYLQFTYPSTMIMVRPEGDPAVLIPALRAAVRLVDKDLPIYDIKLMEERAGVALATHRYNAMLLALFAGTTLLLAAIGIYGVMAHSVTERTREIGIRIALGSGAWSVLGLVLWQSLRWTMIGIAVGVVGSLGVARLLRSMAGVGSLEPRIIIAVSALVLGVSVLAALIPARRAASISPMAALREN